MTHGKNQITDCRLRVPYSTSCSYKIPFLPVVYILHQWLTHKSLHAEQLIT